MVSASEATALLLLATGAAAGGIGAFVTATVIARQLGGAARKPQRAAAGLRAGCLVALFPATLAAFLVGAPWGAGMFGPQASTTVGASLGMALWVFLPVVALGIIGAIAFVAIPGGGASEA